MTHALPPVMTTAAGRSAGLSATSQSAPGVEATSGSGAGVHATSTGGTGVAATSTTGLGASFQGGRAAVRLVPRPAQGAPASGSHQRGELVVDSRGKLWFCAKSGKPGTWRQVAFV